MRSIALTYVLWILLPCTGVHRMYCGRIGTGLLYLFTGGLFGIGWLIDAFLIPEMVRDANARVLAELRDRGPVGLMPAHHGAPPEAGQAVEPVAEVIRNPGIQSAHRVIYCTRCGAAMQVPAAAVGRQYGCPNCRAVLVVPA